MATMSSGKSTVINALLGWDLLHSANEATTSTITKIHNKKSPEFGAVCYCSQKLPIDRKKIASHKLLKAWNNEDYIHYIDVFSNGYSNKIRKSSGNLVYIDTPGPNNSQDNNHQELLDSALNMNDINTIVYVMNCSQLGVNDDYELLSKLHKYITENNKDVIFVLNKVDIVDEERGESLNIIVTNAKLYLENIGFIEPVLIPLMAQMALVAKKSLNGEDLTRKEKNMLINELERFRINKHYLNDEALLNHSEKKKIKRNLNRIIPNLLHRFFTIISPNKKLRNKMELKQFCSYSGINTLENKLLSN